MKKFFKGSTFISILTGLLIMLFTTISFIFFKNSLYFTILYALNIVSVFVIMLFNILKKDDMFYVDKYSCLSVYLFLCLFLIIMDNLTIYLGWNLEVYENLMYFTNIKMYSLIFAVFALTFTLYTIYLLIKDKIAKTPMLLNNTDLNTNKETKKDKKKKKIKKE